MIWVNRTPDGMWNVYVSRERTTRKWLAATTEAPCTREQIDAILRPSIRAAYARYRAAGGTSQLLPVLGRCAAVRYALARANLLTPTEADRTAWSNWAGHAIQRHNRGQGRKRLSGPERMERHTFSINPTRWRKLQALGNGCASEAIRRFVDQSKEQPCEKPTTPTPARS